MTPLRLPFVDCETTGLAKDLHKGPPKDRPRLLEVACVVVELPSFEIVAEKNVVFGFKRDQPVAPYIHPKVIEMHTKNGLWAACEATSTTMYDGGVELERFIVEQGCQGAQLAGANPSFDRRFLEVWLPQLDSLFHYRDFDTNSFWLLREYITGAAGVRDKRNAHRALDDCRDAVKVVEEFFDFMTALVKS